VDRPGPGHGGHRGGADVPVGRDDQPESGTVLIVVSEL
jgi:hypothetical protein